MTIQYHRRLGLFILAVYMFLALPAMAWAQNEVSSAKPPALDDAKLKEKILSRIQNANAGKNDSYKNVDISKIIVERKIPFQVLGQTLFAVRLKILPMLPEQINEFLYLVVDPTLTVQYPDIINLDTGTSILSQVMMDLRRIKLPEKGFGSEVYKGGGVHQIVLISDPFCPYCRHVWEYLFQHKDKIKSLKMSYYPIHTVSAIACAVLDFALQKHMNIFDIINFSYTKLNPSESPTDVLKQYAAAFPLFKSYWGDDLNTAAQKLQAEYLPMIQKEQIEEKNLGIMGTPVTFIDGYMVEGGNIPKFNELMP